VLAKSVAECRATHPVRVVITDSDFDGNCDARPTNVGILANAIRHSSPLVMLLHAPRPEAVARYRGLGAQVVPVARLEDFPALAAGLARALFDEARP
jgi:hypothetical protein